MVPSAKRPISHGMGGEKTPEAAAPLKIPKAGPPTFCCREPDVRDFDRENKRYEAATELMKVILQMECKRVDNESLEIAARRAVQGADILLRVLESGQ